VLFVRKEGEVELFPSTLIPHGYMVEEFQGRKTDGSIPEDKSVYGEAGRNHLRLKTLYQFFNKCRNHLREFTVPRRAPQRIGVSAQEART
jgi:hypothetical protein